MIEKIPVSPADGDFLFHLYCTTRRTELKAFGWDDAMQHQFLLMQWYAQQRSFSLSFPDAEHSIVISQNLQAGRILIDRSENEMLLVDFSLLPDFQNQGIGTFLLGELQEEAAAFAKSLRLSVLPDNPARRLYERLGFRLTDDSGYHIKMEWRS